MTIGAVTGLAHRAQDLEPVGAGEEIVDEDAIVFVRRDQSKSSAAVAASSSVAGSCAPINARATARRSTASSSMTRNRMSGKLDEGPDAFLFSAAISSAKSPNVTDLTR